MKNQVKELTEGMQRLCAVANRIVAQNGQASRIEVDLLLDDLRRLYDVALQLGGDEMPKVESGERRTENGERSAVGEEPAVDREDHMMAMMSTMAAMTAAVEPEPAAPELQEVETSSPQEIETTSPQDVETSGLQDVEASEVRDVETSGLDDLKPQSLEVISPEPEPEPAPIPPMEELEQNDNALLFDEIIIEPEPAPEPETSRPQDVETPSVQGVEAREHEDVKMPEPAPAPQEGTAPQQASLLDYLSMPVQRTLGESLGEGRGQQHPLERKVDDLRTVININDKFSFMSELFRNNMKAYNDFIMNLNAIDSREEALAHVRDIAAQYKWNEDSMAVKAFYKIFDKKF